VQVDHRAGDGRMRADDVGDLGHVDVHADVAVHRHLAQLGDQPGVVLRGEERGVDAEHLGDAQHTATVNGRTSCSILVEIARGDVEHLRECGLAEATFAPQLPHPRSDEGFGHVSQRNNACEESLCIIGMDAAVAVFRS